MNRNFTLVLVVLAILAVAGAFLLKDTAPRNFASGTPTPTPAPLFTLAITDVQSVDIAGLTGQLSIKHTPGGWEVNGQKANDTVAEVIARIAAPAIKQSLPEDRDPQDYGFGSPQLTVTMTAAAKTHVLSFGDDALPDKTDIYLREGGAGKIMVMSNSDVNTLRDWLSTPPVLATPTPPPTAAPAGAGVTGTLGITGTAPITGLPGLEGSTLITSTGATTGTGKSAP